MDEITTYALKDEITKKEQLITIHVRGGHMEIRPHGFGTYDSPDGHGSPILIDLFNDKLRVFVWGDVNSETATHEIDLAGSLESKRAEPWPLEEPLPYWARTGGVLHGREGE